MEEAQTEEPEGMNPMPTVEEREGDIIVATLFQLTIRIQVAPDRAS
jgi:hypothetical protein